MIKLLSTQPTVYDLTVNTAKWWNPVERKGLYSTKCFHIVSRCDIIHGNFEQLIEFRSNYNTHTHDAAPT
jgi:hypothetical protein